MTVHCHGPRCTSTGRATHWADDRDWPPPNWFVMRSERGWLAGCRWICLVEAAAARGLPAPRMGWTDERAAGQVPMPE